MKLYRALAVVLCSREMRDAHRVLTLFAQEQGKIQVVAHGAAKPSSRKRGAVQPFVVSDFLLRQGRNLDSISECEGQEFFPGLWGDLDKLIYAAHIAELVDSLTMENHPHPELFSHIINTLRELDKTDDPELLTRWFELKLVSLLGYLPELKSCVNCGDPISGPTVRFSSAAGGLICSACAQEARTLVVDRGAAAAMQTLLSWDVDRIYRLRPAQSSRNQMYAIMREYLQWHMEKRAKTMLFMDKLKSFHDYK